MLLPDLERLLGKDNVRKTPLYKLAYSYDASQLEGETRVVVWPTETKQVSKIISLCKFEKVDIVIRGGGTNLVGNTIPKDSIVIDMSKLNKIIKVDTKNRTAVVEPGIVLKKLNMQLARKNLFFPVVPSSEKAATLGGMIACNAAGNRAVKYGKTSEWITELRIVNGEGREVRLYHAKEIVDFCGTEGILGAVIEAKILLAPLIYENSASFYTFETAVEMMDKVLELKKDPHVIAIEYIDPKTAELNGEEKLWKLFVEYDNYSGAFKTKKAIEEAWEEREAAYPILASHMYNIIEDPRVPYDKILPFLKFLEDENVAHFGHIGIGLIHPCFKKGEETKAKVVLEYALELGGVVTGEHGIGLRKKEWVTKERKKRLKELKEIYDPKGILNRGKMI